MPHEHNHVARTLAEKVRELRLHALKTAQEAFASSYEQEATKDLAFTLERLRTPQAHHFFAVDRLVQDWREVGQEEFFASLFVSNFVGSMVLVGPVPEAMIPVMLTEPRVAQVPSPRHPGVYILMM